MAEQKSTYITLDVETAGNRLRIHSTLSIGACLVTPEKKDFHNYYRDGHVFYAELKPDSHKFDMEALKVACSQLTCLNTVREIKEDQRYNHLHPDFLPGAVFYLMQCFCEEPEHAIKRFSNWIKNVSPDGNRIIGITDTVFFDSGHINLLFGKYSTEPSPFGWTGLDLDSLYKGFARRSDAILEELGITDTRSHPHRADQDAVLLAQNSQVLLFDLMGWKQ